MTVVNIWRHTDLIVRDDSERDGGDVERVGDEVDDVPHVADVLPETHLPQLLYLAPYQA